jgi:sporulation protein YlmC with PRC-barrel domain
MRIEDLRPGVDVVSSDGHKLGTLHRLVFEEDTLKLTHVVVDTGILRSGTPLWEGGWGLSHDRMVPLSAVEGATSDRVVLSMTPREFRERSVDYVEEYFQQAPDAEPGRLDTSDIRRAAMSIPGEPGPYLMFEKRALPPDAVDIVDGSPVWRLNPHEKVGEVERVLYDEDTGRMTALVIRRGFLFSREAVLPANHIVEVVGDVVRTEIDDITLESLQEYEPED